MRNAKSQTVEKEVKNLYPVSREIHKDIHSNKTYTFNMYLYLKTQKSTKLRLVCMLQENPCFSQIVMMRISNNHI